jgi:hypothetical protein
MQTVLSRRTTLALVTTLALAAASPALAGPPLVCFPFDIGTATSLPWDGAHGWKGMRADYDLERLNGDTLGLLTPATPVIVRMETLRRAALYATLDPTAARALTSALLARAKEKGAAGKPDALALFDAGYFVETLKQTAPISSSAAAAAAEVRHVDGYALVRESLAMSRNDPAIEFAAALITSHPARPGHDEHAQRARAGVQGNVLLASNIGQLQR